MVSLVLSIKKSNYFTFTTVYRLCLVGIIHLTSILTEAYLPTYLAITVPFSHGPALSKSILHLFSIASTNKLRGDDVFQSVCLQK